MENGEEETFKKLKKATFNDVLSRMTNQSADEQRYGLWPTILETMGWTREEYIKEIISRTEDSNDLSQFF